MADKLILVDTSILIDYYRKTDKANSVWLSLINREYNFSISAITKFEIYSGATPNQLSFWDTIMEYISILDFDEACVNIAVTINADLKRKRKQISIADLFIAATAINHNLPLATLNIKHFERINDLSLIV